MYDRTAIMKSAWARYRAAYGTSKTFQRGAFAEALRIEWSIAKRAAVIAAEDEARRERAITDFRQLRLPLLLPELSPLEARIDALKYLPFRFDIGAMERTIRAENATP